MNSRSQAEALPKGAPVESMIAAVKKKHGLDKVLNEMPLDEVVKVYLKAAA